MLTNIYCLRIPLLVYELKIPLDIYVIKVRGFDFWDVYILKSSSSKWTLQIYR